MRSPFFPAVGMRAGGRKSLPLRMAARLARSTSRPRYSSVVALLLWPRKPDDSPVRPRLPYARATGRYIMEKLSRIYPGSGHRELA